MNPERLQTENVEAVPDRLLFIEPSSETSPKPTIDQITKKITASFSNKTEWGPRYRGLHRCRCGVFSTNTDYKLPNGMIINSLAVHYVAWHRKDVPVNDLDKINTLDDGEEEPTSEVLQPPPRSR